MRTLVLILALCFAVLVVRVGEAEDRAYFGRFGFSIEGLASPVGAAFLPDGRVLIVSAFDPEIRAFTADGLVDRGWASARVVRPRIARAAGIASTRTGTVFVLDRGAPRVLVFDADATPLASFGEFGWGEGQFVQPGAIAVDDAHIYIADTGNHRIQIFTHDGVFMRAVGAYGTEVGSFIHPGGVALDAAGMMYVSDTENDRVQVLGADRSGGRAWGVRGSFRGLLASPRGIALDGDLVLVADSRNHRVQVFERTGWAVSAWGLHALLPREGEGKLETPVSVAVSWDGTRAAVCEPIENRCQVFLRLEPGEQPEQREPGEESPTTHYGPRAAAGERILFLTSPDTQSIEVYDTSRAEPILISSFGGHGPEYGRFRRITGLVYDQASRTLYVADGAARRLQTFRIDHAPGEPPRFRPTMASLIRAIDFEAYQRSTPVLRGMPVIEPGAIALSPAGDMLVADARSGGVYVFDSKFGYVHRLEQEDEEGTTAPCVSDLAVRESDGMIAVVDPIAAVVRFVRSDGELVRSVLIAGAQDGMACAPFGAAFAPDGSLYLTDEAGCRVVRVSPENGAIGGWGAAGLGRGEMWRPKGVVMDSHDRLIVLDFGNHRGQVFSLDGTFLQAFGARLFVLPTRDQRPIR